MIKEACDELVVVELSKDANETPALPPMGVEEGADEAEDGVQAEGDGDADKSKRQTVRN